MTGFSERKAYVVQTSQKVIARCMLMTTDPGDLVLDPTCGSGTTAYVAEQWGRRWITIDTSRVALAIARQRLLTAKFDYFKLRPITPEEAERNPHGTWLSQSSRHTPCAVAADQRSPQSHEAEPSRPQPPSEKGYGTRSVPATLRSVPATFLCKTVPHITLKSIAQNTNLDPIFARHEPILEERLTACNKALGKVSESLRNDLLAKLAAKQRAEGARSISDADRRRWTLPAKGDGTRSVPATYGNGTKKNGGEPDDGPPNVGVAFGPQYGPVTAKQVEELIKPASRRYDDLVIAGFSFDGPAQQVIEEAQHPKLRIHIAHIRPDVNPAMSGLLKAQPGSQLFTVFGQPRTSVKGPDKRGEFVVRMERVDIYNPIDNSISSTGADKVAAWFLDSDYDGRTFCITQAFFPDRSAWDKLAKALGDVVDASAFEAFSGTVSLPFAAGKHKRVAVKVIDPRGNEVMQAHGLK